MQYRSSELAAPLPQLHDRRAIPLTHRAHRRHRLNHGRRQEVARPGLEGAPGALRNHEGGAHARPVRGRAEALREDERVVRLDPARLLQEHRDRRDLQAARRARRRGGRARRGRPHVRRREDQPHREARGAARGAAQPLEHADPRRRRRRDARGERGARAHQGLRRARAQRRVEGAHGQADHRHRQPRHRRLRPRPGDGDRGAQAVLQARPQSPLCLQRRRHPHRRGAARGQCGDDALPHRVEDVHHAGAQLFGAIRRNSLRNSPTARPSSPLSRRRR